MKRKTKTVNSISGGKTSAYIAVHYPADYEVFSLVCIDDEECRPKDPGIIKYVNDKIQRFVPQFGEFIATAEDDATLYAMRDLEQIIGKEIIWVRGKSFDDVIDLGTQTRLPSWARRYCTEQMKLVPIFNWWFNEIGEKVNMRIGFRADEFDRMERFFNNSDPCNFKIPVACSTRGQRLQRHEVFKWRFCSFPLIKNGITEQDIIDYWLKNGKLSGSLFNESRQIQFPKVSNCIGCFHKKVETLAVMAALHPEKMKWFAEQENKDMGTWLDSRMRYEEIIRSSNNWTADMLKEAGASCDSGGCHD